MMSVGREVWPLMFIGIALLSILSYLRSYKEDCLLFEKRMREAFLWENMGEFGGDTNLEIMYYIYSDKEDVEKVKNIAYEIIRQVNGP